MKPVLRPHLARFILDHFEAGGQQAVILTGPPGLGKASLARETAAASGWPAVVLTIGDGKFGRDPQTFAERMIEGIAEIVDEDPTHEDTDEARAAKIQRLLRRLARHSRSSRLPVCFVIEGLARVPDEERATLAALMALVPFGNEGFKFLLPNAPIGFSHPAIPKNEVSTFTPPPFSKEEIQRAFSEFGLGTEDIDSISRASRGYPEALVTIHNVLSASSDASSALREIPNSLHEVYQLEWKQHEPFSESEQLGLALVLEEPEMASQEAINSFLAGAELQAVAFDRFSFLQVATAEVRFRSRSLADFAAERLRPFRARAVDVLVQTLMAPDGSARNLERVTRVLAESQQNAKLLSVLTDSRFSQLVRLAGSRSAVRKAATRGVSAALAEAKHFAALEFLVQRSAVDSHISGQSGRAEIRALVANGQVSLALGLVDAEPLVEARFRRLCTVARAERELGGTTSPEVVSQIRDLFGSLAPHAFGSETLDVATDLIFVAPDLATTLVSQRGVDEDAHQSLDEAFATLALRAALASDIDQDSTTSATLAAQVKSPRLRALVTAAPLAQSDRSAAAVIEQSRAIEEVGDRIYLFEQWMLANRERGDALAVLETALQLCVASASVTTTARTYRHLAQCLLFHPTLHQLSFFVGEIQAQLSNLARIGPEQELHRLMILLARAVWRFDEEEGSKRFMKAYVDISDCTDPLTRAAGLARLASSLARADHSRRLEDTEQLHSAVESDLDAAVTHLLTSTADHTEALRGVISSLAPYLLEKAVRLAGALNLPFRRDEALVECIASHVASAPIDWKPDVLKDALLAISNPRHRDEGLRSIRDAIQLRGLPSQQPSAVQAFAALFRTGVAPRARSVGIAHVARRTDHDGLRNSLAVEAAGDARLVAGSRDKRDALLQLAALLAQAAPSLAAALVREVRPELGAPNSEGANAISAVALRLAVRATQGLFRCGALSRAQFGQLFAAILEAEDGTSRVSLLSDLLITSVLCNAAVDDVTTLVDEIDRQLSMVATTDPQARTNAIALGAPALLLAGREMLAENHLRELAVSFRDVALERAARTLRLGVCPDEPFEELPGSSPPLTNERANRLLAIARQLHSDGAAFTVIEQVVQGITHADSRLSISEAQRRALVAQIEHIAKSKFPSADGIRHEGYLVCVDALLDAHLRPTSSRLGANALSARARNLPNVADAAFVLAYIATYASDKDRTSLVEEAMRDAQHLPSLADRIDRLQLLARLAATFDSGRAKAALREALLALASFDGEDAAERRRSLISLAYRIEPAFGVSLAAKADNDPAKKSIEDARTAHDLKASFRRDLIPLCSAPLEDMSRVASQLIGAMNARRQSPTSEELLRRALERGLDISLVEAYPLLALAVQNEIRRCESRPQIALETLSPLVDSCLRAAVISREIGRRLDTQLPGPPSQFEATGIVDAPHDSAVAFIAGRAGFTEAERRLAAWLETLENQHVLIADPYFDNAFLRLLTLVPQRAPGSNVTVLTSAASVREAFGADFQAGVREAWWRLTADMPPSCRIILCSFRGTNNQSPIHDRWWVAEDSGMDLGSSPSGLSGRLTSIRSMTSEESSRLRNLLGAFAREETTAIDGRTIDYTHFRLD